MGLFKTYSEKEVKRVKPLVAKINALEEKMQKLSDSELRGKTDYFKKQLADGKTLDDILPEEMCIRDRICGVTPKTRLVFPLSL